MEWYHVVAFGLAWLMGLRAGYIFFKGITNGDPTSWKHLRGRGRVTYIEDDFLNDRWHILVTFHGDPLPQIVTILYDDVPEDVRVGDLIENIKGNLEVCPLKIKASVHP